MNNDNKNALIVILFHIIVFLILPVSFLTYCILIASWIILGLLTPFCYSVLFYYTFYYEQYFKKTSLIKECISEFRGIFFHCIGDTIFYTSIGPVLYIFMMIDLVYEYKYDKEHKENQRKKIPWILLKENGGKY